MPLLSHSRSHLTRSRCLLLLAWLLTTLGWPADIRAAYILSDEEAAIADFLVEHPDQQRPSMQLDPILCQVARERAQDMADRGYFGHVNPDGLAANFLVREAGYELPAWWGFGPADNYIESIAAGYDDPDDTWVGWMNSPHHRTHLLALEPFYQNQTSFGVGYAYSARSTYHHYWVVLTAPPNTAVDPFVDPTTPPNQSSGSSSASSSSSAAYSAASSSSQKKEQKKKKKKKKKKSKKK